MRSKSLHQVTYVFDIVGSDINKTSTNALDHIPQLDLANKLSKTLGRTIKQGASFRVVGMGASLQPIAAAGSGDFSPETGWSANLIMKYIPTTFHSAQAWRDMRTHYLRQLNYRKGLAGRTRYDEFEVSYDDDSVTDRTSTIYVGGINDPAAESVVLTSTEGYDDEDGLGTGHISCRHLYTAKNPVQPAGSLVEKDLLFDDTIQYKEAKFTEKFPEPNFLYHDVGLSAPTFYNHDIGLDDIYPTGGVANSDSNFFPADNHVDVLCGLFKPYMYLSSPDDENFIHDTMRLYLTFYIEGWQTLISKPKRKGGRKGGKRRTRRTRKGRK